MSKKKISFDFYKVVIKGMAFNSLSDGFLGIQEGKYESFKEVRGYIREVYNLQFNKNTNFWAGQLRKYRNDLPALARQGEDEKELELDDDQGVIERNSFIYNDEREILIWQYDNYANHPENFSEFLTVILGVDIELAPILTESALRLLMSGKTNALKFEISVARPTAPSLYNSNEFNSNIFSLMNNSGSDLFLLKGGIDLRSKEKSSLSESLKNGLYQLVQAGSAKKAKVLIEQNGNKEFIDLVTDRVKVTRHLTSQRKSIPFCTMVDMLESAYQEKEEVLNAIFGTEKNSLL